MMGGGRCCRSTRSPGRLRRTVRFQLVQSEPHSSSPIDWGETTIPSDVTLGATVDVPNSRQSGTLRSESVQSESWAGGVGAEAGELVGIEAGTADQVKPSRTSGALFRVQQTASPCPKPVTNNTISYRRVCCLTPFSEESAYAPAPSCETPATAVGSPRE